MIQRPTPKQEVKIDYVVNLVRLVVFYASKDAVTEFQEFGHITSYDEVPNKYRIFVDARYDLDEVVEFISNYG